MKQQQLLHLLHAQNCQLLENWKSKSLDHYFCYWPRCKTLKRLLKHMSTCQAGNNCMEPDCSSSRQILNHWKCCTRDDCLVCLRLKQAEKIWYCGKTSGEWGLIFRSFFGRHWLVYVVHLDSLTGEVIEGVSSCLEYIPLKVVEQKDSRKADSWNTLAVN